MQKSMWKVKKEKEQKWSLFFIVKKLFTSGKIKV